MCHSRIPSVPSTQKQFLRSIRHQILLQTTGPANVDRLLIGAGASFCISTGAGPAPDLVLELMTERDL
jgi:hypothetical protein